MRLALPFVLICTAAAPVTAQSDSTHHAFDLNAISVIAHPVPVAIRLSAASASVVDRDAIVRLGARTLPDILDFLPGLLFVNRDGAGELPMVISRGFFGGGETDYALLLIDGVPAAEGRTGAVEWTQISATSIERVEVLRGPGSAVYGDAALGAVINVVTRRSQRAHGLVADLSAGSWQGAGGNVRAYHATGAGVLIGSAEVDRAGGYREHSAATRLRGSLEHRWDEAGLPGGYVRMTATRLENEEPGPLDAAGFEAGPRHAHPLFGGDTRTRNAFEASGGTSGTRLGAGRLTVDARVRRTEQDRVRTLLVTPSFGDTQAHDEGEWNVFGKTQLATTGRIGTLVTGLEATSIRYTSRYSEPGGGASLSEGSGRRESWAAYAEAERSIGDRIRVYGGARFERIVTHGESMGETDRSRYSRWSPRVGLNIEYRSTATSPGNAFVLFTGSFKAPTLDQLYDVREIRAGGASFNLSNAGLRPQRARGLEAGLLQKLDAGRSIGLEAALALYLLDMDDEIDFDLATFRYGNILKSRHRGIELSLAAALPGGIDLQHALTITDVEFMGGENAGNRLKNIPGVAAQTSVSLAVAGGARLTLGHRWSGHTYLDDANTERLESPAMLDATLRWSRGRLGLSLHATNVLDAHGASIGALLQDPASGVEERLLYPVAGRALRLTLSIGEGS